MDESTNNIAPLYCPDDKIRKLSEDIHKVINKHCEQRRFSYVEITGLLNRIIDNLHREMDDV